MQLYLSSLSIPNPAAYSALFKNTPRRVAIIHTAWNVAPREQSEPSIQATARTLTGMQFNVGYLDLKDFAGNAPALRAALAPFGGVWVTGGNAFYLNYYMRESGFDAMLGDLLSDAFVYGGESAGAVVAGKTLHGIELLDNPADAPDVLWEGLGLVDYGIIPHWGKGKYAGRLYQAHDEMELFGPVKTLNDKNVIIVK